MKYYLIALPFEDGTRYYFNQRTTVAHSELAHQFPNTDLAKKSFKKSVFKDCPHRFIEREYKF